MEAPPHTAVVIVAAIGTMWHVCLNPRRFVRRRHHAAEDQIRAPDPAAVSGAKGNVSSRIVYPDQMRSVTTETYNHDFDSHLALLRLIAIGQGALHYSLTNDITSDLRDNSWKGTIRLC